MASRSLLQLPSVALLFALSCLLPACVDDLRTEGEVPAQSGVLLPDASGSTVSPDEACSRLAAAEAKARKSLDCDDSTLPSCPERLRFAGSFVCAEVDEGTVDECVAAINAYSTCEDFDTRPCIVTVVRDSCVSTASVDAQAPVDSGPPDTSDGGVEGGKDASVTDASTDGPADAKAD